MRGTGSSCGRRSALFTDHYVLNVCDYPTLIATKAARIVDTVGGSPVLEFGMRRGHGPSVDEGARAALIGGCVATSNVQAAVALGREPRGTHSHSMVQTYLALYGGGAPEGPSRGEIVAFRAFARAYPDECVLLVDAVDTLRSGVPNAITVFRELRDAGFEPVGVRLDSGDLAHLSVQAALLLDAAGFDRASIVLSGELDELTIWQILTQIDVEARREGLDPASIRRRLVYGVGTRLITSAGNSGLDGVYKLTAVGDGRGGWSPALELSESAAKIPVVGPNRTFRLRDRRGRAVADLLMCDDEEPFGESDEQLLRDPFRAEVSRTLRREEMVGWEELHELVWAGRARQGERLTLEAIIERRARDVDELDTGVRRLINPHTYHVSLSPALWQRQQGAIAQLRRKGA